MNRLGFKSFCTNNFQHFSSICGVFCLLMFFACDNSNVSLDNHSPSKNKVSSDLSISTTSSDEAFTNIADEYWANNLKKSPVFATSLGVRAYDNDLSDLSIAAYEQNKIDLEKFTQQLKEIESKALSKKEQVNFDILSLQIADQLHEYLYDIAKYNILTNRSGPHLDLAYMPASLPFNKEIDFTSYLNRLTKIPLYLQQSQARLAVAIVKKYVQPCKSMHGYEDSIAVHIVDNPSDSVFYKPFAGDLPQALAKQSAGGKQSAKWQAMQKQAQSIIKQKVIPAFAGFYKFYLTQYKPACRKLDGIMHVKNGGEYYNYLLRHYTTTDLSADEIHNIGLTEVARIRQEMQKIMEQVKFKGSFADFLKFLRTDKRFYVTDRQDLLEKTAYISKKIDEQLPKLFTKFPMIPFTIKPIPDDIAKKTTTAYYEPPAGDGTRAGVYRVNLSKLNTRPLFEIMALSLHEAVPGHHFQISLSQEQDMPPYRRFADFTAFVEGWALYAERLGKEVGLYKDDPYSDFGRLSYEMWRATRLVVDTGLHAKAWTRQQAIDYMQKNTALSLHNITSEVDRYITWPGQATAYKIGELKIRQLRKKAELGLGDNFDKRLFHDAVLQNGAIPLDLLTQNINQWIEQSRLEQSRLEQSRLNKQN